ncbi:hypothetical protein Aperf_G00000066050 [Anoplocephala perfoliata]
MNRAKRRGFGFGGIGHLRESVKRRLFDIYAVPHVPDPRVEVSRLTQMSFPRIHIPSALTPADSNSTPPDNNTTNFQLLVAQAIVDYALKHCGGKEKLTQTKDTSSSCGISKSHSDDEPTSTAKLLMKTKEIEFWDTGILSLCSQPPEWFPRELTGKGKQKSSTALTSKAKRVRFDETVVHAGSDLDNVPDQAFLEVDDTTKDDDAAIEVHEKGDEVLETEVTQDDDKESEDERWNGEPVAQEEEDEEGDDYMETYFDNGENDIDDFNIQMHDIGDDLDGDGGSFRD